MITMVGDRESDIYDLFARRPANVHLLCRSAHPRAMTTGGLLPEHCAALPEQARETIEVPPRGKQKARQATVAVRFGAIELKRPERAGQRHQPSSVALWGVDVSEVDPPEGRGAAALAPADNARGRDVGGGAPDRHLVSHALDYRAGVPVVEIALPGHRGFANGGGRWLPKLAVVALIAAVRAMQLVLARDGTTGQPVTDAVAAADMTALRQLNLTPGRAHREAQNPHDDTLLAWYAWIVARLGGWSGYTSRGYKPPGPKTMHHGLIQADQILLGWRLANRSADLQLP